MIGDMIARLRGAGRQDPPPAVPAVPYLVVRLGASRVPVNHGVLFDAVVPFPGAVAGQPEPFALIVADVRVFSRLATPRADVDLVKVQSGVIGARATSVLARPVTPRVGVLVPAPLASALEQRLVVPGEVLGLLCETDATGSLTDVAVHVALVPYCLGEGGAT
jgi:hypothetical protein